MQLYLAPMEGITGHLVRNAFYHNFGCIDKYFTPFIPAAKRMNYKILRDINPDNNIGITLIPQLISNQSCEILDMIEQLKNFGYSEVNINLGCPSGTVTGKKRGSGMLQFPDELDRFLDEIYQKADVPVSIKTRIGFNTIEDWPQLLDIYAKYPMSEFIIHPRLRREFYDGFTHLEAFEEAYNINNGSLRPILCYNGDIWNMSCLEEVTSRFPDVSCIMIGRGLLARPDLACEIKGSSLPDVRTSLRNFVDEIYEGYLSIFSGEKNAVRHMKEIWANLGKRFEGSDKLLKRMMKNQNAAEYQAIVRQIFETLELVP